MVAFAAVVGPGVLAGLSDDDPAGITTYSILGADHGYRLLWVIVLSTAARNETAQRLFESSGFRRTMVEMTRELDGPDDAVRK